MNIMTLGSQFDFTPCTALLSAIEPFERNRQRRHELWVLTCYISLPVVKKFLIKLKESIRVTDCYLSFNFSEIFKEGPSATEERLGEIRKWCKRFKINFEWRALSSSSLVHSKGYAVIQRVNGDITAGATLVTSANFTESGFFGGNVEFGYISTKKRDAKEFEECYDELWDKFGSPIDLEKVKEQDYLLKYSVLASGVFLHKWSGSLSQLVGIKYSLTEEAKERGSIAPELQELGFESGDTFTRQVLPLKELPAKEIPRQFITSFTIETYWGRWCPKEAWNAIKQRLRGADPFISAFKNATTSKKMDEIMKEAKETQEKLVKRELIKEVPSDHIERWRERINNLRDNEGRLERLFTGYEGHVLPYEFEHTAQVNELFDSLLETIDLSGKQSKAMSKVHTTLEFGTLDDLNLLEEDIEQIEQMMANKY